MSCEYARMSFANTFWYCSNVSVVAKPISVSMTLLAIWFVANSSSWFSVCESTFAASVSARKIGQLYYMNKMASTSAVCSLFISTDSKSSLSTSKMLRKYLACSSSK